ncbi:MAG: hypothetical protein ACRD2L_17310 [Terriglobia bacterium]
MPSAGNETIEIRQEWIIGSMLDSLARFDSPFGGHGPIIYGTAQSEDVPELAREFQRLRDQWKRDTAHLSLTKDMALHPAYQRIIGMGFRVVSLIIEEMRANPDNWFWALRALTGQNPVKPEHRGNVSEMTRDWIEWWNRRFEC